MSERAQNSRDLAKPVTESHHMLRRTARKKERKLEQANPERDYRVESTVRGPFGWRVERTR